MTTRKTPPDQEKKDKEKEERVNHSHASELIIPLDFSRAERALEFVESLNGLPVVYKVGSELFMSAGPEIVRELVHRKHRVFLDLKFHDIPNTVAHAARLAALLHVDMFTLHLVGGSAMVKAVVQELSEIPTLKPKVLGVTVLTSFDDIRWSEVTKSLTGHAVDVDVSVDGLVDSGVSWGVDGIVCSPQELAAIRERYPNLYTVVPGIRPEGYQSDDQARVMTPAHAREAGASAIVMGRPITSAPHPREVVEQVLRDLAAMEATA